MLKTCSVCGASADYHLDSAASEGYRCADCVLTKIPDEQGELSGLYELGESLGEVCGEPLDDLYNDFGGEA